VPLSVHGDPVNVPVPLLANDTVPVGVTAVPAELSVTVAVHVTLPPMLIEDGEQLTLVMVVRDVTVTVLLPVLVAWMVSPLYVADTVRVPAAVAVIVTLQLPDARVHVPPGVNVTVPVGVLGVPAADVSATVAVHVVLWPTTIVDGVQLTVVLVLRKLTVMVAEPELAGCAESPLYVPVMVWLPAALGVYVTEQLDDAPVPDSVQLLAGVKAPEPVFVNITVPVGVVGELNVSVTVAVHVVDWLTTIVLGEHAIVVTVVPCWTLTVVEPVLPLWFESPPYVAVTVSVPRAPGVIVTEQLDDAPVPANVHVPLGAKLTVPVGVLGVPAALSVTVAVHDVDCPSLTVDGVQFTVVVVVLKLTVTMALPVLPLWFESPG